MKKLKTRDKQTLRFLKWIRRYPEWWRLICTPGDEHMNINMIHTLVSHLAEEQLYEIIFVLIMVHRKESYVKDISSYMLLDMVIENWSGKRKDREQVITDILEYFE